MASRWARFARGWLAAFVATVVAAFSHTIAGGGHPPLVVIAIALSFSGMTCVWLAGRRFSRLRLAVSVTLSQVLYHGLFSLFGVATTGTSGSTGAAYGHHHGIVLDTTGFGSTAPHGVVAIDPLMMSSHLAAAAVTVLLMLHGERCAAAIASFAGLTISTMLSSIRFVLSGHLSRPLQVTRMPRVETRPARALHLVPLIGFLRHRGPPAMPRLA